MTHTRILVAVASVVLVAAVLLRIADPTPIARLRDAVFDSYLRQAPRVADPRLPVRVVAIDEPSLAALGQWPWPRRQFADLVDRLAQAGAKAIVVDLVMPEPDRMSPDAIARALASNAGGGATETAELLDALRRFPSGDMALGRAIAAASVVVGFAAEDSAIAAPEAARTGFAVAGDDPRAFVPSFRGAVSSRQEIGAGARGYGAVNWVPDGDQVLRRVPLLVVAGGRLLPSLSLEALRLALGETSVFVKSSGSSGGAAFGQRTGVEFVRVGRSVLPTTPEGELWLRFASPDPRRTISAHRVLTTDFDDREVRDRIVLIGATAVGLLDLRATPLAASVPGVEVHAQAVEQMLSGEHLVRPSYATGAEIVFLVVAGALVAWLILVSGPLVAALAVVGAVAIVVVLSWFAFVRAGLLFDPVYPALALAALYVSGSLGTYVRTELERARVRSAFGHYVSPAVVDELARRPEKLALGGEMRDVTLLFADVRDFSKIAEGMNAGRLIGFVNELFGPLSDVILARQGTIDKYMGDGVMAFWNAPLDQPNHAEQACRAALDMVEALDELNARWTATGAADETVRIGIGLNTGPCAAGNVGTARRFDYSVLGDAVNVAARLEAETKTFGCSIVCGQRTMAAAPGLAFLPVDRVQLRGRSQPEQVYALLGDETLATSAAFRDLSRSHVRMLEALAGGHAVAALAALEDGVRQAVPQYAPLADYFRARIATDGASTVSAA